MVRGSGLIVGLAIAILTCFHAAEAGDPRIEALLKEIKALKARVAELEKRLRPADPKAVEARRQAERSATESVKVSRQVAADSKKKALLTELGKKVSITGAVELEGSYQRLTPKLGRRRESSGFSLATAEIFFSAQINKYTKGVIHLLFEDGETDPVNVDEAFILIGQTDTIPWYFLGGRVYPAIGLFESFMVSDPLTLELFEMRATALEAGYARRWFNLSLGIFKSDFQKLGDDDDQVNTFYARADFTPKIAGWDMRLGIAWTNNIAAGRGLTAELAQGAVADFVPGFGLTAKAKGKWAALIFELLGALEDFEAGELRFAPAGATVRPMAWNLEVAFFPMEGLTLAFRCERTRDAFLLLPERQLGVSVAYDIFEDTSLAMEYLFGEFQNQDERHLITLQLAVGF